VAARRGLQVLEEPAHAAPDLEGPLRPESDHLRFLVSSQSGQSESNAHRRIYSPECCRYTTPRQMSEPQNTESSRSQYVGKPATGRFGLFVAMRVMVFDPRRPGLFQGVAPLRNRYETVGRYACGEEFMVSYADIAVKGSVQNVQNLAQTAFAANGFTVKWESATKGHAVKGSRGLNLVLGAFAQYYGVDFEIYPGQDAAVLRLLKSNTGLAGGIWGMMKVSK